MEFAPTSEGKWPIRLIGASADTASMVSRTAVFSVGRARRPGSALALRAVDRTRSQGLATRRSVAAITDLAVCALLAVAANLVLSAAVGAVPVSVEVPFAALAVVVVLATPLGYLVVGESGNRQTLGKRLAGLAVASVDGGPLPYRAAAERLAIRVSPLTWAAVARSALRSGRGGRNPSPYVAWTRSVILDRCVAHHLASAVPVAAPAAPDLLARRTASTCQCIDLRRLDGVDAELYATSHLVALARFRDHGRASLLCQETATAWMAHEDGDGEFRLHRVAQLPPTIPRP